MPRPKNKIQLLQQSQANFDKLIQLIDSYEDSEIEFVAGSLNRNIRDVLWHLHEWHLMTLTWHEVGMKGDKPDMPAQGYTWRTLPALNEQIWLSGQNIDYPEARQKLESSHQKLKALIENYSDDELFTKKKYKWTGSTSLGAYLISSTSSHYDWAYKLVKKMMP